MSVAAISFEKRNAHRVVPSPKATGKLHFTRSGNAYHVGIGPILAIQLEVRSLDGERVFPGSVHLGVTFREDVMPSVGGDAPEGIVALPADSFRSLSPFSEMWMGSDPNQM